MKPIRDLGPTERMLAWMQQRGLNQNDLAQRIGVSPQDISNWKVRGMPSNRYRQVAQALEISIEELLGWPGRLLPAGVSRIVNLDENPEYPAVRRVRFKISAGASGYAITQIDDEHLDDAPIVFRRDWLKARNFDPAYLVAIRVSGASMEPGLYEGDTVVLNLADLTPRDGEVFAANYEGELVVKRLVRDAGAWWLSSDNPDQRRYPRKLCSEDVQLIGRIVHKQSERI